jgi:hypothetical protein
MIPVFFEAFEENSTALLHFSQGLEENQREMFKSEQYKDS